MLARSAGTEGPWKQPSIGAASDTTKGSTLQDDRVATFAPRLKRTDGLIDWSMNAFAVERRVRGFQPWPGAHTMHNSRRLILWRASPETMTESAAASGQIIEAHGEKLVVACGDNTTLRIHELQPADARRMTARRGRRDRHPVGDN